MKEPPLHRASTHALEACGRAVELLKACGFVWFYTSMSSEAVYYKLDGFEGTIRVAAHRFSRGEYRAGAPPTAGLIIFGESQGEFSEEKILDAVHRGLGRYFMSRLSFERGMPLHDAIAGGRGPITQARKVRQPF